MPVAGGAASRRALSAVKPASWRSPPLQRAYSLLTVGPLCDCCNLSHRDQVSSNFAYVEHCWSRVFGLQQPGQRRLVLDRKCHCDYKFNLVYHIILRLLRGKLSFLYRCEVLGYNINVSTNRIVNYTKISYYTLQSTITLYCTLKTMK